MKCYLVEARWYHAGYKPTLEEYLENGKVSIAMPIVMILSYICSANPIKKEELEFLEDMPDMLNLSGKLCRIIDDYGTSSVSINTNIHTRVKNIIMLYVSKVNYNYERFFYGVPMGTH